MDVPEVRRRLRAAIVAARAEAQERRARVDAATRDYDAFLAERAVPLFHTFANALVAEGLRFKVFTPAGSVRLAAEGAGEDYIELALDSTGDQPQVIGRSSRGRGRRLVTSERPVKEGADVASLTEDDVMDYLIGEIGAFIASR
jgi:hypothetical protein